MNIYLPLFLRLKFFLFSLIVICGFCFFGSAIANDKPVELFRQGYEVIYQTSYASVEECTPDKPAVLGSGYLFFCSGYEYLYKYQGVYVLSGTFTYQGSRYTSSYLCFENDDDKDCVSGALFRK